MGNNLKFWGENEEVISKTLQLFLEMTMGCGSAKVHRHIRHPYALSYYLCAHDQPPHTDTHVSVVVLVVVVVARRC